MKRLIVLMAASGALAVAGCEDPVGGEPETYEPPMEEPAAPAAADAGAPVEATVPADPPPPVDPATLPALLARMAESPMRVEPIDPGSPSYRFLVAP